MLVTSLSRKSQKVLLQRVSDLLDKLLSKLKRYISCASEKHFSRGKGEWPHIKPAKIFYRNSLLSVG